MIKTIKTHLYCYDDHRGFTEDVRKRFCDNSRYTVISFPTKEEFIGYLEKEKEGSFCKVAILGAHDNKEQFELIESLTQEIKRIDPHTGLILIGPAEMMEEIRKSVKFNIDAYIPKNVNAILRIHNTVKKVISEHNIGVYRKKRNLSLYALLAFLLISLVFVTAFFIRQPRYF